jgi:hypothetical protein
MIITIIIRAIQLKLVIRSHYKLLRLSLSSPSLSFTGLHTPLLPSRVWFCWIPNFFFSVNVIKFTVFWDVTIISFVDKQQKFTGRHLERMATDASGTSALNYERPKCSAPEYNNNNIYRREKLRCQLTFLTLLGLELRPFCRTARSQSLYRLATGWTAEGSQLGSR